MMSFGWIASFLSSHRRQADRYIAMRRRLESRIAKLEAQKEVDGLRINELMRQIRCTQDFIDRMSATNREQTACSMFAADALVEKKTGTENGYARHR